MWMLGTKSGSSLRAISAFTAELSISPAPLFFISKGGGTISGFLTLMSWIQNVPRKGYGPSNKLLHHECPNFINGLTH